MLMIWHKSVEYKLIILLQAVNDGVNIIIIFTHLIITIVHSLHNDNTYASYYTNSHSVSNATHHFSCQEVDI